MQATILVAEQRRALPDWRDASVKSSRRALVQSRNLRQIPVKNQAPDFTGADKVCALKTYF